MAKQACDHVNYHFLSTASNLPSLNDLLMKTL